MKTAKEIAEATRPYIIYLHTEKEFVKDLEKVIIKYAKQQVEIACKKQKAICRAEYSINRTKNPQEIKDIIDNSPAPIIKYE